MTLSRLRFQASFFLTCSLLGNPLLWAAPVVWSGGTNTDFTLGGNWVGGNPPTDNLTSDIATFSGAPPSNQPSLNSAYSVNGVSLSGGYTLGGSGALTLGSGGFVATGSNTISLQSLRLGANATLNWINTTTVSPGVEIDTNGFALTIRTQDTSGLNLSNAVISGTGNVTFRAGSGTRVITVGPANTFTGDVLVSTTNLTFSKLANGGTPSSFGQGTGDVTLGDASSVVTLTYTGTGDETDRLFKAGNGSANVTITNNGSGPLAFNNTGAYGGATTSESRALILAGSHSVGGTVLTGHSTFSSRLTDFADHPLSLTKTGAGVWELSNPNNSFTGGITIAGGSLRIASDGALGHINNPIAFTTSNNSLVATATTTLHANRIITVDAGRTALFNIIVIGAAEFLQIDSKITGAGNVQRAGSATNSGVLRFTNDENDYTGNFAASNGTVEFTSVANAGSPSALGAGTGITLGNGSSGAAFRYIGTTNTTTTRALNWTATTGTMSLTNNGTGTVGFLNTGNMVTGNGAKNWTLTGTNAGNNVLAQVINNSPTAGVVSVTKTGVGRWILTGTNSYTGPTLISGGNLQVGLAGVGSLAADTTVSLTGATSRLSGTGTVFGNTTLTLGAITPGDEGGAAAGKLTFNNLTFANTSAANVIQLVLFNTSSFDQLDITGTLSVTALSNLLVDGSSYIPSFQDSFDLLTWQNLAFTGFSVGSNRSGGNGGSNLFLPDLTPFNPDWFWDISPLTTGPGSLTITVIPEPSRTLFLALGLCAWCLRRRR